MPFWNNIYFINANSPLMEQMIFFHDHSMIFIIMTMTFLMSLILYYSLSKFTVTNINNNQLIETIWTMTPMIILMLIAIPSIHLLYLMEEIYKPLLTVKVTGHQWYWNYEITNLNINFDSFMISTMNLKKNNFRLLETDNYLNLPLHTLSQILVTSNDVIHSWTIPAMGIKTDAIPGRLNQINIFPVRPGLYFGQCSEICGLNHSFMPISLQISKFSMFKLWLLSKNN